MRIKYKAETLIKVINDNRFWNWIQVYEKLGIEGVCLYAQDDNRYDVRYIFANNDFITKINEMLKENGMKSKNKKLKMLKPKYREQAICWNLMNYSPTMRDIEDCLLLEYGEVNED